MDIVLVGAPGSGTRALGRALAQRRGADLVDVDALLPADPSLDATAPTLDAQPAAPERPRVFVADAALARPRLRRGLYHGRTVVWLDAPAPRLASRVRMGPHLVADAGPDLVAALEAHLAAMAPYYAAGVRLDATQSTAELVDAVTRALERPAPAGTLVVRADTPLGLLELGEGIIARGILDALTGLRGHRAVVLTERRVWAQVGDRIGAVLRESGMPFDVVLVPPGERAKTLGAQFRTLRELATLRLSRTDPIVAVGDDRLCDAATFTAGVYLRGVPLVMVPTTSLGQIDLAIGGKGSVNLDLGRNLAGTFHQPVGIVLDVDLLRDENPRQRRAALAEALKYALLGDEALFALLDDVARDRPGRALVGDDVLLELVERCAMGKLRVVLSDERDLGGQRMALNLGHTLSHALEAATNYRMLHGEAVAYGLRTALSIGVELGETPAPVAARAENVLDVLGLGTAPLAVDPGALMTLLESDKKRQRGRLRWVLTSGSGFTIRGDVPEPVVARAVRSTLLGRPVR